MSDLRTKILAERTLAMRSHEKEKTLVLGTLLGELDRIPLKTDSLKDEHVLAVIKKIVEANTDILKNRPDAENKKELQFEIELLSAYLPTNLSTEELTSIITEFVKSEQLSGIKAIGSVMKMLKEKYAGQYDGKNALQNVDKDFLKGTTINGPLYLNALQNADKDFLKGTIINGSLYLNALQNADKDFLKGTNLNGSLYLSNLKNVDKDFLKDTTINGLNLNALQNADKDRLKNNVKQLKTGYNKKHGYIYF